MPVKHLIIETILTLAGAAVTIVATTTGITTVGTGTGTPTGNASTLSSMVPVVTTATTCVDLALPGRPSDCPANANLCQNNLYRALMQQQCPRTCGYCTVVQSSKTFDSIFYIWSTSNPLK